MTFPVVNTADSILRAIGRFLSDPGALLGMAAVLVAAAAPWLLKLKKRFAGSAARNWPTAPASIDVVSVVERGEGDMVAYFATLTYFYRNPDLQTGEYERAFPLEAVAKDWVEQFKSRQVMVHVNPKQPEVSVLLDFDIEALTVCPAPGLDEALRMEKIPELPKAYLLLSSISELVGKVGLIASVGMLVRCIAHGGQAQPTWIFITIGVLLALTLISFFVVLLRAEDEGGYRSFLHTYKFWCPTWMRWALNFSVGLFALTWILEKLDPDLLMVLFRGTRPLIPYLLLCWGFLISTAFHLAIVRSQEKARAARGSAGYQNARSVS